MKRILRVFFIVSAVLFLFSCERKEESPEYFESVLLEDVQFESDYLEDGVATYNIYLPADYESSGKKYPVLYLFHGVTDNHSAWNSKGKVKEITDKAIKEGTVSPFIIVMPDGFNCFYVNGAKNVDGKQEGNDWESYYWKELRPRIENTYPVKKGRENTAIAGNSMGGYGAMYYSFNYPSRFCFCYTMSAAVDNIGIFIDRKLPSLEEIFNKRGYDETVYDRLPHFVMDCGKADILSIGFNEKTHKYLDSACFSHTLNICNGIHDWSFWRESYERMLPYLATHFGDSK